MAVDHWVRQLHDFSGRNRLLFYRELKSGSLNVSPDHGPFRWAPIDELLGGSAIKSSELFVPIPPDLQGDELEEAEAKRQKRLADMAKRLTTIYRKGRENNEERGLHTQYLAFGALGWRNDDGQATPNAPLLLMPIEIEPVARSGEEFRMSPIDEPEINPTLVAFLDEKQGMKVDSESILDSITLPSERIDRDRLLEAFGEICSALPDLTVRPTVLVGNFSFAKLPMVNDLKRSLELLVGNDLIAALAGDTDAEASIRSEFQTDVDPALPDHADPGDEFLVLDADASQNVAINRALRGESLVIQGPPGTGKSQTIANLIASFSAQGKHVLFVAEKKAAIDAVLKNLEKVGLGRLMMVLHGGRIRKADVAKELQAALEDLQNPQVPDTTQLVKDLKRTRKRLVAYNSALHEVAEPHGISYFDARLRTVGAEPAYRVDVPAGVLSKLNNDSIESAAQAAMELSDLGYSEMIRGENPWSNSSLNSEVAAEAAIAALDELHKAAEELDRQSAQVARAADIEQRDNIPALDDITLTSRELRTAASRFTPAALETDLDSLYQELEPAEGGVFARTWAAFFNADFRKARQLVADLSADADGSDDLIDRRSAIKRLDGAAADWQEVIGSSPRLVDDSGLAAALLAFRDAVQKFERIADLGVSEESLREAEARIKSLRAAQDSVYQWPAINELRHSLESSGLLDCTQELLEAELDAQEKAASLRSSCHDAIAKRLRKKSAPLASFKASTHERIAREFVEADVEHLRVASQRVLRAVGSNAVRARNANPTQDKLVRREANKKKRHVPVRRMIEQAPNVIGALKPCWAMSPLAVSHLLPAGSDFFDVVIFDEASQVQPAEAIPSIMRASQVVVAGDSKQLPPTRFFASGDADGDGDDEEEEDLSLTTGMESILGAMNTVLPKSATLQWHYRSRDERLINFSNVHIYDKMLKTFPGVEAEGRVKKVMAESVAERVVDLVMAHAGETPDRTLGVITLSAKFAREVENEVHRRRANLPPSAAAISDFFLETSTERFFVKNIETVQGDERDDIILAAELTRSPDGRVRNSLGPINYEGGERRMNVAVTRARRSMTLVTNVAYDELRPSSFGNNGGEFFREYVRYAEALGNDLGAKAQAARALNPFEIDVKQRLEQAGLQLIPQYGVAGYFIDFVTRHPDDPNRLILAIEADGAAYHSSPTARDRDRLRQQVLEDLGWRFHRIWSTDWFENPEAETQRVVQAQEDAVVALEQPVIDTPQASSSENESGRAADLDRGEPKRDGRCPIRIVPKAPISEYSHARLVRLVQWLMSDGVLRTDEELIQLASDELGYGRKGRLIVQELTKAVRGARALRGDGWPI